MFVGGSQSLPVVFNDSQWLSMVLSGYHRFLLLVVLNGLSAIRLFQVVLNDYHVVVHNVCRWFSFFINVSQ